MKTSITGAVLILFFAWCASAAMLQFAGQRAELVVSEVSERTVRLRLFPLDQDDKVAPPASSSVLVPFATTEKWRAREVTGEKELRVGELRVSVKPQPLTVSVRRADGKLTQELTFEDVTNSAVKFRTDAPVLGLGEGANQFDRRGAFYPMLNGQRAAFLATHGGTIPVPFLIGTDGWALFMHRPWGGIRLAGGKFLPRKDSKEPLDIRRIHL